MAIIAAHEAAGEVVLFTTVDFPSEFFTRVFLNVFFLTVLTCQMLGTQILLSRRLGRSIFIHLHILFTFIFLGSSILLI